MKEKLSHISHWARKISWFFIALVACGKATCWSEPYESAQQLLATYLSPQVFVQGESLVLSSLTRSFALTDSDSLSATTAPRRKPTEGQKWAQFEEEYGVRDRSGSMFLGAIQSAKYQLDKSVFAVDDFVDNFERTIQFNYDLANNQMKFGGGYDARRAMRVYTDPWRDAWENARLKSDVDLDIFSGRAWLGVRLVIPVGD